MHKSKQPSSSVITEVNWTDISKLHRTLRLFCVCSLQRYIRMVSVRSMVFHWYSVVTSLNRTYFYSIAWSGAVDDFQFFPTYINSCFIVIDFSFRELNIGPQIMSICWACKLQSLTVFDVECTLPSWGSKKVAVFYILGGCPFLFVS